MTRATAVPEWGSSAKTARTVAGFPAGRGTSLRVASVTTPRVPSDPTNSRVRSKPTTSLRVWEPVRTTRPSASTTSSPATWSAVTPYFTHRRPPAFVAMFPPILDCRKLAGSGAYTSPCSAAARSTSAVTVPGPTVTSRFATSTGPMWFMAAVETTTPSGKPTAPPARPVPAPRIETAVRHRCAQARAVLTSSTVRAATATAGSPSGAAREESRTSSSRTSWSTLVRPGRSRRSSATADERAKQVISLA